MNTNFASEQELVSCIKSYIQSAPDSILKPGGNNHVLTELNLGYGIADIVAVSYPETASDRKNFLEYFDISLLNLIQKNEKVSFEDIVYITRSPESKIKLSLSSLMEEQFVAFRKGYYFSSREYADTLTDCIAIEAKLHDWRRALKQAYRYQWFSNKSFVFLPAENITVPKRNIAMFKQYNVGLAGVSKENGIEVIHSPKERNPVSATMRIALNEHLLFQDNS